MPWVSFLNILLGGRPVSSFSGRGEFAAAVGPAMPADAMGKRRLPAIRARAGIYRPQCIMGAAPVAFGARCAALGCLHKGIILGVRFAGCGKRPSAPS